MDKYFNPEAQEELARRAEVFGPEAKAEAEGEWTELVERVRAEIAAGTPPDEERLRPLADRWRNIVRTFGGGNTGTSRGVVQPYRAGRRETIPHGASDADLMDFMSAVIQRHGGWG